VLAKTTSAKRKSDLIEPKLSKNAVTVLEKRYLRKDENGNFIETPKEMFLRVASHIAKAEYNYKAVKQEVKKVRNIFYEVMARREFLPNSPTFTGAGTRLGQLSACFVLPIEDDMESILDTQHKMGMVHKSGGGTGFSFSRLRPKNSMVQSTGGVSCGPLGFLQMYNDTTEQIKQGGTRRGANMGILNVEHPDILEFINYKREEGRLNNFNISVALTENFMKALSKNEKYFLTNPRDKKVAKKISARSVFRRIVNNAWHNGEPGIIFLDHINRDNPTPKLGKIESTNPCGEQPLRPYESCNLGSINLSTLITSEKKIDYRRLDYLVRVAVRFMDNVIDMNKFPFEEIKKETKRTRKIGLGVMGFADMLLQLGIPYNSKRALRLAEIVMKFINKKALAYSRRLAKKRGAFPIYKKSVYFDLGVEPPRNATRTTIAPTGTVSIIGGCSSGIEPIFALVFTKNILDGEKLLEINPHFLKVAKKFGFFSKKLMKRVAEKGSIQDFEEIPEEVKKIFVTAKDISPKWHVRMQAAFQKHTDNAVSKTINFPFEAKKKDIKEAYMLAYKLGCKGLTVYRDGSRNIQVLTTNGSSKKKKEISPVPAPIEGQPPKIHPRKRPAVVHGFTYKIKTAYGNLYVTINEDDKGDPFEIFTHMGKSGGFFAAKAEAISRLVSLALRSGVDIKDIIIQIKGIRGPSPIWGEEGMVLSLPDAIGQILDRHMNRKSGQMELSYEKDEEEFQPQKLIEENPSRKERSIADIGLAPACPECGSMLELGEGCLKCPSCGFSRCG